MIMKKIMLLLALMPLVLFTACSSDTEETQEIEYVLAISKWDYMEKINGVTIHTNLFFSNLRDVHILATDHNNPFTNVEGVWGEQNEGFFTYTRDKNKISIQLKDRILHGIINKDTIVFTDDKNQGQKTIVFNKLKRTDW